MDMNLLAAMGPWEWPEDAGQSILEVLGDANAERDDRLLAASLAGDLVVMNDELGEALLSTALDSGEPDELRAQAAVSFGATFEQAFMEEFEDPDDVPVSEELFLRVQESLRQLYTDGGAPKEVRRRVLEASVRAPEDWHVDAVRAAYASGDDEWVVTAVFCMQYIRGFDDQILESLRSGSPSVFYEAVRAAEANELDAAWPSVAAVLESGNAEKPLLLAAIEAVATIRPNEAGAVLVDLIDSDDEEIAEAAHEAIAMAEAFGMDDEDFDDEW